MWFLLQLGTSWPILSVTIWGGDLLFSIIHLPPLTVDSLWLSPSWLHSPQTVINTSYGDPSPSIVISYLHLVDKHSLLRWWLSISSRDPFLPYDSVLFHNLLFDGPYTQYDTINTVSSVLCILKLELRSTVNLVSLYSLCFALSFI